MTEGRCHRRKKMMGRGADGGCGTEERPCRPGSRVPGKTPATEPESSEKPITLDIDLFSQSRKVLCERSPFDVPEDGSVSGLSAPTLPSGLASLLKHSDSRKRHKKSHSGADKKSSRQGERSRAGNIWVETEEYFRDLALPDIDALSELSLSSSLADRKCFPLFGNEPEALTNVNMHGNASHLGTGNSGNGSLFVAKEEVRDPVIKEEVVDVRDEVKDILKYEMEENVRQLMEIDSLRTHSLAPEENVCSVSNSSGSLEWILGSRSRILLTSERPSKKRKLLGSDAGLEKILAACPCEGNLSLCHFCSKGGTSNDLNRLVICSSCKAAVHQKCYGAQDSGDEPWLCSWCQQRNEVGNSDGRCVLCPKQNGALKPIHKSVENDGPVEFAHLFCSQWMPEVYVEDLTMMEPIMNMEGIKDTRRKLVCNVCKVKCGACVRCSHGTCRASFHPICAREARHRLEVWGKYGCDNIELRAFCSKHSEAHESSRSPLSEDPCVTVGSDFSVSNHLPPTPSMKKSHKFKDECKNGDKVALHIETPEASSDISGNTESEEIALSDSNLNARPVSNCNEAQQHMNVGVRERKNSEDVNPSESLNFILILKKLVDRGKVDVKDVASEIGVSPDSLSATLADGYLLPDLHCKLVKWLKTHAYMTTLQKGLKVKIKTGMVSMSETGTVDCSNGVTVSDSEISDPVAVKSVPPRRRTKSNIRILRDNEIMCSDGICSNNGIVVDKMKSDQLIKEEEENLSDITVPDATVKSSTKLDILHNSLQKPLSKNNGSLAKASNCSLSEGVELEEASSHNRNSSMDLEQGVPPCSDPCPSCTNGELSHLGASSDVTDTCYSQDQHSKGNGMICKSDEVHMEQLVKAKKLGILEHCPEDELEGELMYYRKRLLHNSVERKQLADNLVCKIAKNLPLEIDMQRQQRWDTVLVNQYHSDLREAKKQGRKERKHKEAQAVLAAATAAAAASSRNSSLRKDVLEESTRQENLLKTSNSNRRIGSSSQLMPRAKETLSRMAVSRTSSEKHSDYVLSVSDFSRDQPRSCDICRRFETILNPILVCSSCKVAVHLDCYRSVKESTGPWHCELCEDLLSSRSSGAPSVNFWEKPYFVAECGLCAGTTGAFRKSSDGQWVHAFCAEWVFESTFRRGQINPVQGMDTIPKGIDICCICRRNHGACVKCSYGHCQTTFHPTCARSAGFYMIGGGKLQHKAYCQKHSLDQRAKANTQKHGVEELKSLKQIRVELERLRLLCERIIKREKIKRELVLCSHEILAVKRDHVARSVLVHSPFFPPDVSSESATTSLKGHTDGCKSCNEAIQRSDDNTVDSALSIKHRIKVPISMDIDQKTDDSSTSQIHFTRKPTERVKFSGKQIPHKHFFASHNLLDDGEQSSKSRKHIETFEKELVMTSDEASMKNQRLPKGYVYIPVDCLQEEKQCNPSASSAEPLEPDG